MTEQEQEAFDQLEYNEKVSLILKALARDIDKGIIKNISLHEMGPGIIHLIYYPHQSINPKQKK